MSLPFSQEQFFDAFRRYNEAVWPAQAGLWIAAAGALALVFAPLKPRGRLISAVLAGLWLWMALAYHVAFFLAINPAAALFAALFVAGAADFAWSGAWRGRLEFAWPGALRGACAVALVAYALVGYALLGAALGQRYPAAPTFGLPCPTTLFTAGLLLLLRSPFPRHVLVVPFVWTLIGTQGALLLGVTQDLGLPVAGAALLWLALFGMKKKEAFV